VVAELGSLLTRASTAPPDQGAGRARTHTVTPVEKRVTASHEHQGLGPVPLSRQVTFEHLRAAHLGASVEQRRLALRRSLSVLGKQCSAGEMTQAINYLRSSIVEKWFATKPLAIARGSSNYKYHIGRFAASRAVMLSLGLALPVFGATHFEMMEQPPPEWCDAAMEELVAALVATRARLRRVCRPASLTLHSVDEGVALHRSSTAPRSRRTTLLGS
jgi:hypothetical protein